MDNESTLPSTFSLYPNSLKSDLSVTKGHFDFQLSPSHICEVDELQNCTCLIPPKVAKQSIEFSLVISLYLSNRFQGTKDSTLAHKVLKLVPQNQLYIHVNPHESMMTVPSKKSLAQIPRVLQKRYKKKIPKLQFLNYSSLNLKQLNILSHWREAEYFPKVHLFIFFSKRRFLLGLIDLVACDLCSSQSSRPVRSSGLSRAQFAPFEKDLTFEWRGKSQGFGKGPKNLFLLALYYFFFLNKKTLLKIK